MAKEFYRLNVNYETAQDFLIYLKKRKEEIEQKMKDNQALINSLELQLREEKITK
jgi:hypothetical protein